MSKKIEIKLWIMLLVGFYSIVLSFSIEKLVNLNLVIPSIYWNMSHQPSFALDTMTYNNQTGIETITVDPFIKYICINWK